MSYTVSENGSSETNGPLKGVKNVTGDSVRTDVSVGEFDTDGMFSSVGNLTIGTLRAHEKWLKPKLPKVDKGKVESILGLLGFKEPTLVSVFKNAGVGQQIGKFTANHLDLDCLPLLQEHHLIRNLSIFLGDALVILDIARSVRLYLRSGVQCSLMSRHTPHQKLLCDRQRETVCIILKKYVLVTDTRSLSMSDVMKHCHLENWSKSFALHGLSLRHLPLLRDHHLETILRMPDNELKVLLQLCNGLRVSLRIRPRSTATLKSSMKRERPNRDEHFSKRPRLS